VHNKDDESEHQLNHLSSLKKVCEKKKMVTHFVRAADPRVVRDEESTRKKSHTAATSKAAKSPKLRISNLKMKLQASAEWAVSKSLNKTTKKRSVRTPKNMEIYCTHHSKKTCNPFSTR
jgi:hypothetical protein